MADQINGTLTANESLGAELETQRTIELPAVLGDLADVVITDPQDGDVIKYDAEQEKFVNGEDLNAPAWGNITGDIEDQTDLQNEFVTKFKETVGWVCKNLFPITLEGMKKLNTAGTWSGNAYTLYGITFTVNSDLSVTVSGTHTAGTGDSIFNLCRYTIPAGRYKVNGIPSGASELGYHLKMAYDGGGTIILTTNNYVIPTTGQTDKPAQIVVVSSITGSVTFKPMLYKESIKNDTYEPYHASVEDSKYNRSEANVLGAKNLIPYPYFHASGRVNRGITYTTAQEGSLIANGTNTEANLDSFFTIFVSTTLNGSFTVNGCPSGGASNKYWIVVYVDNVEVTKDYGSGATFTVTEGNTVSIQARVYRGVTVSNIEFKPMLRLASDPDDTWQPYAKTNQELTVDKCENSVIANVENGAMASQAYNLGKTFIRDGAFCIAKSAIAQGESFTLNTNYIVQNLGDEASVNNADIKLPSSDARQMITMPEGYTSTTKGSWYLKKGSKVCVCMQLNKNDNTAIGNSWVDIMTMPPGYRPQSNVYFKVCGNSEVKNAVARVSASDNKLQIISEDKGLYGYFEYEAFR